MDCSTPGLPVHHQLPEPTQTHVHGVSEGKLRPERERLAPSQNADVQAGSCQYSQDRFCPNIGCSVSRPQGDLCISFPDLVHPVSTERSYPVGACLAPVDPLEASAPLHQGPPKVTLSLQFLQPSHPPESHLEAPPRSLPPSPTPPRDGTSPRSELSLASSSEGLMWLCLKWTHCPPWGSGKSKASVSTLRCVNCLRTRLSGASQTGEHSRSPRLVATPVPPPRDLSDGADRTPA